MKRIAGVMGIVLVLVAMNSSISATPRAKAAPMNAVILNKFLCTALSFAFFDVAPIPCQSAGAMDANLIGFTDVIGQKTSNLIAPPPLLPSGEPIPGTFPLPVDLSTLKYEGDHIAKKEDFAAIDRDLDQLHEIDGDMIVIVFVDEQFPVQIKVDNGTIADSNGVDRGPEWVCGQSGGTTFGDDPDCLPGAPDKNGAVVFSLRPNAIKGKRGPGKISIVQDRTPLDLTFTVVGEARDIKFTNLETNLEVGADGGTADPDAASPLNTRVKVTPAKDDDCALPGSAGGFLDANGTAQRTVSLVRAFDSDGTSISGAFVRWQSDAPDIGTVAAGLTPTIDLGTFGIGAPNIACGTALPGTFHLKAQTLTHQSPDGTGTVLDPAAVNGVRRSSTFTVVGAPATIALTATPVTCDGTSSSTVSANVVDENGNPAADGQVVNFDVVALGAADPIHAKVKDGVATSVIKPLASAQTSVTVNVSASANAGKFFDLQTATNSVRIDCGNPATSGSTAGAAGAAPAGGGAGAAQAAPAGTIHGPNTGSGPSADGDGVDTFLWSIAALSLGGLALVGARFATRKVR